MEILNLGGVSEGNSPAPKSRKKFRVLLGIGALAAVTGIGSTLAANISLNGGGNVEFGQGVATTAACDDDITLTPISEFSNTEEDATFAMTAIQISGIDLTPEGWDVWNSQWVSGFHPDTHTWDADMQEHSGQYFNAYTSEWTNTCANKSLMIRGYTDNSSYANRTDHYDISSPLILNGLDYTRPNNDINDPSGYNTGVGFRFETYQDGSGYDWNYWDIADCDGDYSDGCQNGPVFLSNNLYGNVFWDNSTVTIHINAWDSTPPLDSRWVDKLTVESAATTPNSWNSDY